MQKYSITVDVKRLVGVSLRALMFLKLLKYAKKHSPAKRKVADMAKGLSKPECECIALNQIGLPIFELIFLSYIF